MHTPYHTGDDVVLHTQNKTHYHCCNPISNEIKLVNVFTHSVKVMKFDSGHKLFLNCMKKKNGNQQGTDCTRTCTVPNVITLTVLCAIRPEIILYIECTAVFLYFKI